MLLPSTGQVIAGLLQSPLLPQSVFITLSVLASSKIQFFL